MLLVRGSVVVVLLCAICNFAVFHVWCCCYRSARGGCCVKSCAYGNASCLVLLLLWLDADTRFGAFSFAVLCVHGCLGPWMAVADCPRSARGGCCVKFCAYGNASCLVLLLLWFDADTRFGAFSFAVFCVHGCLGPWMAVADCPRSIMSWPALD
ncbi:hypothetical protein U1Q18_017250 [Sarracenia purpurea var. burkii]